MDKSDIMYIKILTGELEANAKLIYVLKLSLMLSWITSLFLMLGLLYVT